MSDLNVQLKYKNKTGAYDNLYPRTKGDIVQMNDGRNVEQILDEVTDLYNQVIEDGTNADVNSAPEIIAARNGKSNLKTRLDDEHAQVTAQLQQTEQSLNAQLAQKAYYVTPEMYGAVGDGVTDDTLAVNMAIDSGYNVIFKSPYKVKTLNEVVEKTNLTFKWTESSKLIVASSSAINPVFVIRACEDITVDGLKIYSEDNQIKTDGRVGSTSNVYGINLKVANGKGCKNIKIINCYGENLEFMVKIDSTGPLHSRIDIVNLKTVNTSQPIFCSDTNNLTIRDCDLGCNPSSDKLDHHIYINSNTSNLFIDNIKCTNGVGQCISIGNSNNGIKPQVVRINNVDLYDVEWGFLTINANDVTVSNIIIHSTRGLAQSFAYLSSTERMTFTNLKVDGHFRYIFESARGVDIIVKDSTFGGAVEKLYVALSMNGTFINNVFDRIEHTVDPLIFSPIGRLDDKVLFKNNIFIFDEKWTSSNSIISIQNNSEYLFIDNHFLNYKTTNLNILIENRIDATGANVLFMNNTYKGFNNLSFGLGLAKFVNNTNLDTVS